MLFCGNTFFLFPLMFFFWQNYFRILPLWRIRLIFSFLCLRRRGWPWGGFLDIMRCPFHIFIQSYIDSDNFLSRLFPLLAVNSRRVTVPAQTVRRHTHLVKSDVLRWHLWGALLIKVLYTDPALVVLQRGYCIHKIIQASFKTLMCLCTCPGGTFRMKQLQKVHRAGTRTLQSCCSCRREVCVSDYNSFDVSMSSIWKNPFKS